MMISRVSKMKSVGVSDGILPLNSLKNFLTTFSVYFVSMLLYMPMAWNEKSLAPGGTLLGNSLVMVSL